MSDIQRDREERQHVIEVLKQMRLDYEDFWEENDTEEIKAFNYAIASIETDLKYDLLYEKTSGQADKPTTKNDLGVDYISRKAALDITWHDPSYSDPLNVLTEVRDKIRDLPSVTPQEPKTGHWIAHEVRLPDRTILNYRCSVCGRKLIGYSTETLSEAPYCHCGARMVEPQESEEE